MEEVKEKLWYIKLLHWFVCNFLKNIGVGVLVIAIVLLIIWGVSTLYHRYEMPMMITFWSGVAIFALYQVGRLFSKCS